MKLHEYRGPALNVVDRYGPGGVEINGRTLQRPLIVAADFLLADWIDSAVMLAPDALAPLWPLDARIVLLGGTGFEPSRLKAVRRAFAARETALEAMDLGAACRTYNVLAQEGRAVAALLFPG